MTTTRPGIRIGELAKRTGVTRATIQHYVAEGLLARPKKTGQTMAYYDPTSVARIGFIKEMQARHLPLAVIRALLGPPRGRHGLSALRARSTEHEMAVSRDEVARETGLPASTLSELERLGLVQAHDDGYRPHDVAILRAVGTLSAAGLNTASGFRPEDLLVWRDALGALLIREIELFVRHIVPNHPPPDAMRLASAAIAGSTELIAALHRKLIADFLGGMPRPPAPT